jgi:uncharacterized protein YoxC
VICSKSLTSTVPESKVDLVDELADQVEDLEETLNQRTAEVLEMSESVETFQREAIIREASRDLADTQVEKLASLVEGLTSKTKILSHES